VAAGRVVRPLAKMVATGLAASMLLVVVVTALNTAVLVAASGPAPQVDFVPEGPSIDMTASDQPVLGQEPDIPEPVIPEIPIPSQPAPGPATPGTEGDLISIDIGGGGETASSSVILIVGLTVLSLAPSIVMMLTSFTRIIIVFSLTRNALGLQGVPPNQVLVGLALFLSAFVMWPTLTTLNEEALGPYTAGEISQSEAFDRATIPVREFMLVHTNAEELEVMLDASPDPPPATTDDVSLSVLIPAFMLSEIKSAFIIGFVIFIPFLIIDIVVAASLMALGMMMLPPAFISLPFKLLLFIMVGGWSLVVETLLATYL
jgi:flagellar biosynthetic protein FliP